VSFFGRLFRGRTAAPPDRGLYIDVRCNACGENVRARINPLSELSLDDDGKTYFVRKVLVGKQCFRTMEVRLRYSDLRGTVVDRTVSGGTFVDAHRSDSGQA
jgi:hypothetical protein